MTQKLQLFCLTIILILSFGGRSVSAQTFNKDALLEFAAKKRSKQKKTVQLLPVVYESANLEAAQAVNNDQIWSGGITGLSLSGDGQLLGYWDADQPRLSHTEFLGRVTFEEASSGINNAHATQMVGTMVATGVNANARGMANEATVEAWNWTGDISEMAAEAANGLLTSAHPYIETAGWTQNSSICGSDPEWMWFSLESEDTTKAYQFGYYNAKAQDWDSVAYLAPNYLIIKAAGNNRGEGPSSQPVEHWKYDSELNCVTDSSTERELDGSSTGFESINGASLSKNVLIVGAVTSSSDNFDDLNSIEPTSSTGFGPTDDGRIKPDIVAPTNVFTSTSSGDNAYSTGGGTSAATAVVAGSVALIREQYQNLNADTLSSASIRALLVHTANDIGNTGPDYKTGWGLLNTERAVRFLSAQKADPSSTVLKDTLLSNGGSINLDFEYSSNRPLIITIAWTDPPGTPPSNANDPTDTLLVNDLDLMVTDPDESVHQPWVLDKSSPSTSATTGDNNLDNIEQVYISAVKSGTYSISISHEGTLQSGSQKVSILISEAEPEIIFETIATGHWSEASTWKGGTPPSTSLHHAKLNHSVSLDQTVDIRGVTFDGILAELALNEESLNLYGGVFHNSGGIGFVGDTAAALSILGWDTNSDSMRFKAGYEKLDSLLVNSGADTIRLGSDLNLYSKLSLQSGTLDVSSSELRLVTDTTKTAWLEKSGGDLSGPITYARLYTEQSSGWRMISSPVQNEMFSTLSDSFHTQGGPWADFTVSENESSLWLFDASTQSFSGFTGEDSVFTSGEGYLFYQFQEAPGGSPLPAYLEFTGTEPDSLILDLVRAEEDASSYNLVGNPFAGTLDWHEIVTDGTNIGTSYALWDPAGVSSGGSSGYKYYNSANQLGDAGQYIAPMQGFFIQATDTNPVIRFRQSQKGGVKPNLYGKEVNTLPSFIRFELMNEDGIILDKQAHLIFARDAISGKDAHDVIRMPSLNGVSNQVSFIGEDGEERVFEGRSTDQEFNTIALSVEVNEDGIYLLNWEDWNQIPDEWTIELLDEESNKRINMKSVPEYYFYQEEGILTRFVIDVKQGLQNNVEQHDSPAEYKLSQNYPNPFNPTTNITYSLQNSGYVTIEVFNTLGQIVSVLVNERKNAGWHQVQFDASELSSGVYFYRIEAGEFIQTRSLVLIK